MTEKLSVLWSTPWLRVNTIKQRRCFTNKIFNGLSNFNYYDKCIGLCPDWQDWKSNNALKNASEAMGLADDWLNIKQVIATIMFERTFQQFLINYVCSSSNLKNWLAPTWTSNP